MTTSCLQAFDKMVVSQSININRTQYLLSCHNESIKQLNITRRHGLYRGCQRTIRQLSWTLPR